MRLFIADTHFFHERAIIFGKRYPLITGDHTAKPVDDQEGMFLMKPSGEIVSKEERDRRMGLALVEMNEGLVQRWNSVVAAKDEVWVLGDFAFRNIKGNIDSIFHRLRGKRFLVKGNHDEKEVFSLPWSGIFDYKEIHEDGHNLILSHYPMRSWNKMYRGSYHLHGHEHGNILNYSHHFNALGKGGSCDVGCDVWDWTPVTFQEIVQRIKDTGVRNHDLFDAEGNDRTKRKENID